MTFNSFPAGWQCVLLPLGGSSAEWRKKHTKKKTSKQNQTNMAADSDVSYFFCSVFRGRDRCLLNVNVFSSFSRLNPKCSRSLTSPPRRNGNGRRAKCQFVWTFLMDLISIHSTAPTDLYPCHVAYNNHVWLNMWIATFRTTFRDFFF